jgi:hypothetical protein
VGVVGVVAHWDGDGQGLCECVWGEAVSSYFAEFVD